MYDGLRTPVYFTSCICVCLCFCFAAASAAHHVFQLILSILEAMAKLIYQTTVSFSWFYATLVIMNLPHSVSTNEGNALRALLRDLHIKVNWTGNDPCKGWDFVKCSNNHVVQLNFANLGLNGALPEEITLFTFLKILNLTSNQISGSLPNNFSALMRLETLDLSNNPLSTTFPEVLWEMPSLVYLNLQNCTLIGVLPSEQKKSNLKTLILSNNQLSGNIPNWLLHLNASIMLDCNYFTGAVPTGFNESSYRGNCFDPDFSSHAKYCDKASCPSFYTSNGQSSPPSQKDTKKTRNVAIIVSACLFVMLVLGVIFSVIYVKRKKRRENSESVLQASSITEHRAESSDEPWTPPEGLKRFDLKFLEQVTEGFKNTHEIGSGGSGKVYKASLDDGSLVAMKRASPTKFQGRDQFHNEIILLTKLHHRCLVKLKGFCLEDGEQILLYEFMENGNLDDLLWGTHRYTFLSWLKRIEISLAIAHALDYLHSFVDPPIIHRDVKPSNILLDKQLNAKLSDFGISRSSEGSDDTHISTAPAGTLGYLDPQYFLRRQLTTASDVYSFGVVLIAVFTRQKAIEHGRVGGSNLVEWVKEKLAFQGVKSIVDPMLKDDFKEDAMNTVIELGLRCTVFERAKRPTMKMVISTLESLQSQEVLASDTSQQSFLAESASAAHSLVVTSEAPEDFNVSVSFGAIPSPR